MRIGFVTQPTHTALPPAGSLEIWTSEVARRLAAEGHEVTIHATRVRGQPDGVHDGVRYRFVDHDIDARLARGVRPLHRALPSDRPFFSSPVYPLTYWIRVARALAADGPELVHVYNYSQALPFVRRACPDAVIALHMQCEWLTQLSRGLVARRLAHADLVLGCSDYIAGKIAGRFPELRPRISTLYNGVDVPATLPPTARRPGGPHLLHVGRISPEKGHHVLAVAFNRLVERHPEATLTLVGEEAVIPAAMAVDLSADPAVSGLRTYYEGSYLERFKGMLSDRALKRVSFTGRLAYEEAADYYQAADVFVFPSIFEAMPIPPIEAMAAGLPVVGSAVGGMVESVVDGETGLLVPRGDPDALEAALERLLCDPALCAAYGAAGHQRAAERFGWDSVCSGLIGLARGAGAPLAVAA